MILYTGEEYNFTKFGRKKNCATHGIHIERMVQKILKQHEAVDMKKITFNKSLRNMRLQICLQRPSE